MLNKFILVLFSYLPLPAFAADDESSAGYTLLAAMILLAAFWALTAFGNIGEWLEAKSQLAKEEARARRIDNDEKQAKLDKSAEHN
jgi:hypothetical protein